jgi:hypothetical protein
VLSAFESLRYERTGPVLSFIDSMTWNQKLASNVSASPPGISPLWLREYAGIEYACDLATYCRLKGIACVT